MGRWGATRAESISSFLERRLLEPNKSVTIWNSEPVVVTLVNAEVIRPDDEVSSAGRPWIYASVASGLLALLAFAAALPRPGGYSRRSFVSFGAGNLRRERTSRLKAEKALDRARNEEITLKAELERVVGELRETKEALSSKDASIGETGSKIRAAEEQAATGSPARRGSLFEGCQLVVGVTGGWVQGVVN